MNLTPNIKWSITRDFLVTYDDGSCDINSSGMLYIIKGTIVYFPEGETYTYSGPECVWYDFRSEPMFLRDFTPEVINVFLNKVLQQQDIAKAGPISNPPPKYIIK